MRMLQLDLILTFHKGLTKVTWAILGLTFSGEYAFRCLRQVVFEWHYDRITGAQRKLRRQYVGLTGHAWNRSER